MESVRRAFICIFVLALLMAFPRDAVTNTALTVLNPGFEDPAGGDGVTIDAWVRSGPNFARRDCAGPHSGVWAFWAWMSEAPLHYCQSVDLQALEGDSSLTALLVSCWGKSDGLEGKVYAAWASEAVGATCPVVPQDATLVGTVNGSTTAWTALSESIEVPEEHDAYLNIYIEAEGANVCFDDFEVAGYDPTSVEVLDLAAEEWRALIPAALLLPLIAVFGRRNRRR